MRLTIAARNRSVRDGGGTGLRRPRRRWAPMADDCAICAASV
jgi:hypothetical protein